MNFKQLEAFVWVAELQSFTRAARRIFMSQPAVSFQIKALEEELQVALFNREDRKVTLTEAGKLLYPEARHILQCHYRIKAGLEELRTLQKGHLTIGASTIPAEYILPLLIGDFKKHHPGVNVNLRVSGSGEVFRWVQEREVDFGVTGVSCSAMGIECVPWIKDRMTLIVGPGHPWIKKGAADLDELEREPLILREPGSGTRRTFTAKLAEKGRSLEDFNIVMELGSTRAIVTAVQAGLGVSVVSSLASEDAIMLKKVYEVVLKDVDMIRNFYLVHNNLFFGSFTADAFVSFITSHDINEISNEKDIAFKRA